MQFESNVESENGFGKSYEPEELLEDDDLAQINQDDLGSILKEFETLDCKGPVMKDYQSKNYLLKEKKFYQPDYCNDNIKEKIFEKLPAIGYSPN